MHGTHYSSIRGTSIGEELRKASLSPHPRHPETDMYISLAMHGELGYDLQARRDAGEVVIVDRSPLAVIAYNTYGSRMPDKKRGVEACIQLLNQWDIDVFIFMDAPQALLDERRAKRGESDYFESQGTEYHHRVRAGYEEGLALLNRQEDLVGSITAVDASKAADAIHAEIVRTVAK